MASPASSVPSSNRSTPSITVTADDGRAASVDLLPAPLVGQPKSLTFEIPTVGKQTPGLGAGIRPQQPDRAKSSDETATPTKLGKDLQQAFPAKAQDATLKPAAAASASKKPEAKQSGSLRLLTDLKKTLSSNNLRHTANKDKSSSSATSANGNSKIKHSGDTTPEVRSLFSNGKLCPDLDAVNRALESLKTAGENDPYVSNLTRLAAQLQTARMDSRKALTDAMKERDRGNSEICRALCLSIVQGEHSEVDTKVYAYNILSTQASPGQSLNYLASAWKLVKQNEGKRQDCEKLLGVIAMLKENAIAKDGKPAMSGTKFDFASQGDRVGIESAPTMPKDAVCEPALVRDLLKVPASKENTAVGVASKGGSGTMSPRTEKILDWAGIQAD